MHRIKVALVAFFSAIGLSLSGFALAPAQASTTPVVGSCHHYSWAASNGVSESSAPVSCATQWDARTVFVGRLSTNEPYTTLLTDSRVAAAAYNQCVVPFQRWIGPWSSVAKSAFVFDDFYPTRTQYNAGARWFRCDAVLPGNSWLYAEPHTRPMATVVTASDSACIHYVTAGHWSRVACLAAHQYRQVGYFTVSSTTYPTATRFQQLANARCPAMARTSRWFYTYPARLYWSHGMHLVTCYKATTR